MADAFYIVGPTGSGKSRLAVELAARIGGEIVNADAYQLYHGLEICTAKPARADRAWVPHHLYDVLDPWVLCDAQLYSELARPVISSISERGRLPIVVGGCGLYVKALTHGLSPLPSDESIRQKLSGLTSTERVEWLLVRDPAAALNVNLKNDRYVARALEICLLTGRPQSALRTAWSLQKPSFMGVCLAWERGALYKRIDQRVLQMIADGLVDEIAAAPALSATAEKAIGIREIRAHLAGQTTLAETITAIQQATRQYAKRQEKWFRRETGFHRLEADEATSFEELAETVIRGFPSLQNPDAIA